MTYVDAYLNREKDEIVVAERINGVRRERVFPAVYRAYYEDLKGKYESIFGDRLTKIETRKNSLFKKQLWQASGKKLFESDINPVFRCLEENYLGADSPELVIGFFDIEVDFDPEKGFADPWNPFAPITAISVYHSALETNFTMVLKPRKMAYDVAEQIVNKFENTVLFDDESEMLLAFFDIIQDIDVLTGWNSTGFDIPYMVNRVKRLMGENAMKKFCLWGIMPRKRKYMKFGKEQFTYDLTGRVHLDYLELFMKHNQQQLHSYRLDYVGEIVVSENKIPYDGSFDVLYNDDFEKFIAYNRQDVMLLMKIDRKKKYIDLANQIAHTNTVLLPTTMGSVALIEQAITIEAHRYGKMVPNRKKKDWVEEIDDRIKVELTDEEDDEYDKEDDSKAAVGAYVANPKKGIHNFVGAVDINSLYPSCIRSLNISTETLFGQIRLDLTYAEVTDRVKNRNVKKADAWEGIFAALEYDCVLGKTQDILTLDLEDGSTIQVSGSDLYDYIFDPKNQLVLSANGTLFRRDKPGIIPSLLAKWYAERKEMQGKEKKFSKLEEHESDQTKKKEYKAQKDFWYMRQQARKILLNSLYGALLNEACKFYDQRMGQSVTLTGRSIAKHMGGNVHKVFTGVEDYLGETLIYQDTDSAYFSITPLVGSEYFRTKYPWFTATKEDYIRLYDEAADEVNDTFPPYMDRAFNTTLEAGAIIKAGREIVASKALFIKKKKYACLIYDKEGHRYDQDEHGNQARDDDGNIIHGDIKAMGLDLKRADTPKPMQKFLNVILMDLLTGSGKDEIFAKILEFRREFKSWSSWEKGTPRKVNNLTSYRERIEEHTGVHASKLQTSVMKSGEKRLAVPGHVDAALNWNKLMAMHSDHYSSKISDGAKIVVCKLKPSPLAMKCVAYPIDQMHLPDWFKALPFNDDEMENVIIDKKISNLLTVLDWKISESREDTLFNDFFTFD